MMGGFLVAWKLIRVYYATIYDLRMKHLMLHREIALVCDTKQ